MTGKVLFTASRFSHILNFHLPYLAWFRERGWEVHVACGGETQSIPCADRVFSVPLEKSIFSLKNLGAARKLRADIRREKYDLICANTSLAAFFTRLAVKGLRQRPRLVSICHGYLFDGETPAPRRAPLLLAERVTAPQTDLLMTMNEYDFHIAEKYRLGRRIVGIPGMGVDFDRLLPGEREALRAKWGIARDAFVLIFPAEFSKRKSQSVLIRAMTELPERCVLVLPGDGDLLEECRREAERLGVAPRVVFPGQISEMGPWYAASDAAVSASRSEGLPFNVMEAMHCGLPVVASAVKGHTDLVEDGLNGLLYPYGDAAACAGAVKRLLSDPALRASLGGNARAVSARYSLSSVFPMVTNAYMAVMDMPE